MTGSRQPSYRGTRSAYVRGDVVLVPFPFAERLAEKQRPAVVVSAEEYTKGFGDLIIAQLTSRVNAPPRMGDHRLGDWRGAGLPLPTTVRARVTTIHASRVRKRLGTLSTADLRGVDRGLRTAMAL